MSRRVLSGAVALLLLTPIPLTAFEPGRYVLSFEASRLDAKLAAERPGVGR